MIYTPQHHAAVHEAGHAVIERVVDVTQGGAMIGAGKACHGDSTAADRWNAFGRWTERRKVRHATSVHVGLMIAEMAGAEAERVILETCQVDDGDDRVQIACMADQVFGFGTVDYQLARLRLRTDHLVRRHRAAIERVAVALLGAGILSPDEIDRISGIAPPNLRQTRWSGGPAAADMAGSGATAVR